MAEILGRQPAAPPAVPVEESDEGETEVAEEADVATPSVTEPEVAEVEIAPLREEDEPLTGDDALAWLESLAAGKEEELQVQAQPEPVIAEMPETVLEAPEMEEPASAAVASDTAVQTALGGPPEEESDLLSGDDAVAWLQSLAAGEEDELRAQAEDAPVEPEPEETEAVIAEPTGAAVEAAKAEPAVEAPEAVVEEELAAGEDAAAWLSELSPEKASELEAQLESEGEAAALDQEGDRGYFGWSAFGGKPEEVPAPTAALDVVADESAEPEPALPDLPSAEPEVAILEPEEAVAPPAEVAAPPSEVAAPIVAEPAVGEQPAAAEEPMMEAEAPATALVAEPVETAVPPAEEEVPAPAEIRPEAEPSAVTAEDLDEMRAYTKRKRSDHAARLSLARALWHAGEIQESMQNYGRLIKSGARSDEVMADLEQYVESGPASASVTRTFGDAYMKSGDLNKALEIYNRAMDLL